MAVVTIPTKTAKSTINPTLIKFTGYVKLAQSRIVIYLDSLRTEALMILFKTISNDCSTTLKPLCYD